MEEKRELRRRPDNHDFGSLLMLAVTVGAFLLITWVATEAPSRISNPLKTDWQRHVFAVGILSWESSTRQRKSWNRFIQRITAIGRRHRTYEIQVSGMPGGDPGARHGLRRCCL